MDDHLDSVIHVMYEMSSDGVKLEKYGGSLLYCLLRSSANQRSEIIRKAEEAVMTDEDASCLKDLGYIRNGNQLGKFVLTAQGVWKVEGDVITEKKLIELIDQDFFRRLGDDGRPNDQLKVILAVSIAARLYSDKAVMKMRVEDDLRDRWWNLFEKMSKYLYDMRIIKTDPISSYKSASGIENKSSDVVRHTDKLPRQTRSIFSKTGKNGYYLDIMNSGIPDVEKLAYVIYVVFENNLNSSNVEEIARYMILFFRNNVVEIAHDTFEDQYGDASYDGMIREAFDLAIKNADKWKY